MKGKGGRSKFWARVLPSPLIVLLCTGFFFLGCFAFFFTSGEKGHPQGLQPAKSLLQLDQEGGVGVGEHGSTGDDVVTTIPFQVLSWKPRALLFPKFASPEQCEHIVSLARSRLSPSGLALRKGESASGTKDVRTSSGTFLSAKQDKSGVLAWVEAKMARATMIPRHHGEPFNVLRYELGQKYNSHYDVFNPAEYGPQKTQRMASFLLYLSDVEEGGETMFPFENGQNMNINYDYKQCIGLKVKPRRGDALLFYSQHPNGTIDKTALHGSCPVIRGEKWVATKWIRDSPEERPRR